jgi:erythromycin esterase-like protein
LVRERHGSNAVLVGFSTYDGTVTAASDWDAPAERMTVRPALAGSVEELYHDTGIGDFLLNLRHAPDAVGDELRIDRLTRAIGVVYRPQTERQSHYFFARPAGQFDAVIHYERTIALEPLDPDAAPARGEEETYPTGM